MIWRVQLPCMLLERVLRCIVQKHAGDFQQISFEIIFYSVLVSPAFEFGTVTPNPLLRKILKYFYFLHNASVISFIHICLCVCMYLYIYKAPISILMNILWNYSAVFGFLVHWKTFLVSCPFSSFPGRVQLEEMCGHLSSSDLWLPWSLWSRSLVQYCLPGRSRS